MLVRFLGHVFEMSWHLRAVYLALLALILVGAAVIAGVENIPIEEAVYFSFITGLTVGYGDIVPNTTVGRVVSVALGFVGILFTGLVVAVIVRAVREAWEESQKPD
jgi:voltage-gated potassium channel